MGSGLDIRKNSYNTTELTYQGSYYLSQKGARRPSLKRLKNCYPRTRRHLQVLLLEQ